MKKLFAFVLVLLLALPAYAGAEEAPAVAETVLAQGDGYTLAYDATEFSFYLDGVTEGSDLLVPTQDAPSPVYMLVSRVEDMQAEQASFAGNGYADAGEATLASGLSARVYTLERSGVDYAAYLVEGESAAFCLLTVCSQQAEEYAAQLGNVVTSFAFAGETAQSAA